MQRAPGIVPIDPHRPEVAALLEQADAYLLARYPAELCYLETAAELAKDNVTLLGAFQRDILVGIGAVKVLSDGEATGGSGYGEIKRLFVTAEARGTGLGKGLVEALEAQLSAKGIDIVRLETGVHQPEAVNLYKRLGYRVRGPFGDYSDHEQSIFMEKHLRAMMR